MRERIGQHANVADIRGRGLFVGIELVRDRSDNTPYDRKLKLAERYKANAMKNGLLCYPTGGTVGGEAGDHILLAPPFIITSAEVGELVELIDKTLRETIAEVDAAVA